MTPGRTMLSTPRLPPLRRRAGETMGEYVHRRLRQGIIVGRFPPGLSVTIRGLAAQLGTSAMPVREALRRLVAEGALDQLDNGRARVPMMNDARFAVLIETRVLLETEAAKRALPFVDAAGLAELRRLNAAVQATLGTGDYDRAIEANMAFHRRLFGFPPDDVLSPLIESVWLQIGPFMRAAMLGSRAPYQVDRHLEALAAIAVRDAMALGRAIEADVREGIGHLIPGSPLKPATVAAPGRRKRSVA